MGLFDEAARSRRVNEQLLQMTKSLAAEVSVDRVLAMVAGGLRDLVRATVVNLFLVDSEAGMVHAVALPDSESKKHCEKKGSETQEEQAAKEGDEQAEEDAGGDLSGRDRQLSDAILPQSNVACNASFPWTRGIVGLVARTGKLTVTRDAGQHPQFDPSVDARNLPPAATLLEVEEGATATTASAAQGTAGGSRSEQQDQQQQQQEEGGGGTTKGKTKMGGYGRGGSEMLGCKVYSCICAPVQDSAGNTLAVVQVVNKRSAIVQAEDAGAVGRDQVATPDVEFIARERRASAEAIAHLLRIPDLPPRRDSVDANTVPDSVLAAQLRRKPDDAAMARSHGSPLRPPSFRMSASMARMLGPAPSSIVRVHSSNGASGSAQRRPSRMSSSSVGSHGDDPQVSSPIEQSDGPPPQLRRWSSSTSSTAALARLRAQMAAAMEEAAAPPSPVSEFEPVYGPVRMRAEHRPAARSDGTKAPSDTRAKGKRDEGSDVTSSDDDDLFCTPPSALTGYNSLKSATSAQSDAALSAQGQEREQDKSVSGGTAGWRSGLDPFSTTDVGIVEGVAASAGVCLHKAMLFSDVFRAQRKTEALLSVVKAPIGATDLIDTLDLIMDAVQEATAADRAALFLVDRPGNELWCAVSDDLEGIRVPMGEGVAGYVAASGLTLNIADATMDPRYNPTFDRWRKYQTRSILCVPILDARNRVLAVAEVVNKRPAAFSAGLEDSNAGNRQMRLSGGLFTTTWTESEPQREVGACRPSPVMHPTRPSSSASAAAVGGGSVQPGISRSGTVGTQASMTSASSMSVRSLPRPGVRMSPEADPRADTAASSGSVQGRPRPPPPPPPPIAGRSHHAWPGMNKVPMSPLVDESSPMGTSHDADDEGEAEEEGAEQGRGTGQIAQRKRHREGPGPPPRPSIGNVSHSGSEGSARRRESAPPPASLLDDARRFSSISQVHPSVEVDSTAKGGARRCGVGVGEEGEGEEQVTEEVEGSASDADSGLDAGSLSGGTDDSSSETERRARRVLATTTPTTGRRTSGQSSHSATGRSRAAGAGGIATSTSGRTPVRASGTTASLSTSRFSDRGRRDSGGKAAAANSSSKQATSLRGAALPGYRDPSPTALPAHAGTPPRHQSYEASPGATGTGAAAAGRVASGSRRSHIWRRSPSTPETRKRADRASETPEREFGSGMWVGTPGTAVPFDEDDEDLLLASCVEMARSLQSASLELLMYGVSGRADRRSRADRRRRLWGRSPALPSPIFHHSGDRQKGRMSMGTSAYPFRRLTAAGDAAGATAVSGPNTSRSPPVLRHVHTLPAGDAQWGPSKSFGYHTPSHSSSAGLMGSAAGGDAMGAAVGLGGHEPREGAASVRARPRSDRASPAASASSLHGMDTSSFFSAMEGSGIGRTGLVTSRSAVDAPASAKGDLRHHSSSGFGGTPNSSLAPLHESQSFRVSGGMGVGGAGGGTHSRFMQSFLSGYSSNVRKVSREDDSSDDGLASTRSFSSRCRGGTGDAADQWHHSHRRGRRQSQGSRRRRTLAAGGGGGVDASTSKGNPSSAPRRLTIAAPVGSSRSHRRRSSRSSVHSPHSVQGPQDQPRQRDGSGQAEAGAGGGKQQGQGGAVAVPSVSAHVSQLKQARLNLHMRGRSVDDGLGYSKSPRKRSGSDSRAFSITNSSADSPVVGYEKSPHSSHDHSGRKESPARPSALSLTKPLFGRPRSFGRLEEDMGEGGDAREDSGWGDLPQSPSPVDEFAATPSPRDAVAFGGEEVQSPAYQHQQRESSSSQSSSPHRARTQSAASQIQGSSLRIDRRYRDSAPVGARHSSLDLSPVGKPQSPPVQRNDDEEEEVEEGGGVQLEELPFDAFYPDPDIYEGYVPTRVLEGGRRRYSLTPVSAAHYGMDDLAPRILDLEKSYRFPWFGNDNPVDAPVNGPELVTLLPLPDDPSHPLHQSLPLFWTWDFNPFTVSPNVAGPLVLRMLEATGSVEVSRDACWSADGAEVWAARDLWLDQLAWEQEQRRERAVDAGDAGGSGGEDGDNGGDVEGETEGGDESYHVEPPPEERRIWLHGPTVLAFVEAVRRRYRGCCFHNFAHALHVCQASLVLMASMERFGPWHPDCTQGHREPVVGVAAREGRSEDSVVWGESLPVVSMLTPVERLATLVGALVHDIDHPAVNNDFLVRTEAPLALQYNDSSVLENHHAATGSFLLQDPATALFAALSREQARKARQVVISSILATDMKTHFQMVERLKGMPAPFAPEPASDGAIRFSEVVLHCADLSGQVLPWRMSEQWAERVVSEFQDQADREEAKGLPVTVFMQSLGTPRAQAELQLNFCNYVLMPLWQSVSDLYGTLRPRLDQLKENADTYRRLIAEHADEQGVDGSDKDEEYDEEEEDDLGEEDHTEECQSNK